MRADCTPTDFARLLGAITGLFAPREHLLARALMHPAGLSTEAEYEDKGSLRSLLSDHRAEVEEG